MTNEQRRIDSEKQLRRIRRKEIRQAVKLSKLTETRAKLSNTVYKNYPPGIRPLNFLGSQK